MLGNLFNVMDKKNIYNKNNLLVVFLINIAAIHGVEYRQLVTVDFDQSQEYAGRYNKAKISLEMKYARDLYNKHIVDNPEYSVEPRIPKIIHQIWLGSPFPEKWLWLRETWLKNHPDWQYILWTEKEIEEFGLINKRLYDESINYGEKSDIARYEILYRYGGLYVDTDFECLKSFDSLHHYCDFYAGTKYISGFSLFNSIIGSKIKHPIMKKVIEEIGLIGHAASLISAGDIQATTGPLLFSRCASTCLSTCIDKVVFFPSSYFYPWPHFHRDHKERAEIEKWIKPETFGIHHWHISWRNNI